MSKTIKIAPSILSADFANLERDIRAVEKAGADWLHVDVMDGHFVPNISIGVPVVKSIKKVANIPLDVHLMIENPEKYIEAFAKAGADILTFHYEACSTPQIIQEIKNLGVKAGISIKPNTPIEVLEDFIEAVDLILIMTVEPGFGGQSFMSKCLPKIEKVRAMIEKSKNKPYLQVDGGIDDATAKLAIKAGADVLVAGSYIYNSDDIGKVISKLLLK